MFRLPSVALLVTFDAVVRHRSFSDAADELNLTQSAVSQRIRRLEDETQLQLFEHHNRNVILSKDGESFLELSRSFLIDVAIFQKECLALTGQSRPIRLGIGLALYRYWLAPRLKDFNLEHPNVDIEVITLWHLEQIKVLDVDIAVIPKPSHQSLDTECEKFLFRDSVVPICRPDLLAYAGDFDLEAIAHIGTVENLAATDHVHKGDWTIWLKHFGDRADKVGRPRMRFDSQALSMEAVLQGYGVGLGRVILAADIIASGQVIRPSDPKYVIPCWAKNVLWTSPTVAKHPTTRLISDWLAEQITQTVITL
ncbi:LysR family transcriptional regulator [Rhizobium rhizogenes]|uniref:LysR family transcriptional regulator n=1 Tax=Rhizobium rhizogenes TaxID=359 RepID=UPI0015735479|nr:LysR family transcriptional regulator [Rhizobium rhizogenes]NTF85445.1 LysR family transcriptional regulator [Rhizobium rhizogenes]